MNPQSLWGKESTQELALKTNPLLITLTYVIYQLAMLFSWALICREIPHREKFSPITYQTSEKPSRHLNSGFYCYWAILRISFSCLLLPKVDSQVTNKKQNFTKLLCEHVSSDLSSLPDTLLSAVTGLFRTEIWRADTDELGTMHKFTLNHQQQTALICLP